MSLAIKQSERKINWAVGQILAGKTGSFQRKQYEIEILFYVLITIFVASL